MWSLRTKSGLQRWDFKRCSVPQSRVWKVLLATSVFSRAGFKIKLQDKKKCKCSINSIVLINIVLKNSSYLHIHTITWGRLLCSIWKQQLASRDSERTKSTHDNLPSQSCHSRTQGDQFGLFLLNHNVTRMKLVEFGRSPGCLNSANFHQFQECLHTGIYLKSC